MSTQDVAGVARKRPATVPIPSSSNKSFFNSMRSKFKLGHSRTYSDASVLAGASEAPYGTSADDNARSNTDTGHSPTNQFPGPRAASPLSRDRAEPVMQGLNGTPTEILASPSSVDGAGADQTNAADRSPNGAAVASGTVMLIASHARFNSGEVPTSTLSPNIAAAMTDLANAQKNLKTQKLSVVERGLNRIGDTIDGETEKVNPLIDAAKPIASVLESKLHDFAYGIPVFMNALNEVGKIHPFIQVVVIAFKAVYTLESARHGNENKVILLYIEMKDMLSVLLRLRDMKEIGKSKEDKLVELSESTAKDIRACANVCDAYSRKRLIVKFLNAPIWEGRLASFVSTFSQRRADFEFALAVQTAVTTDAINQKVDEMLILFRRLLSPEQSKLQRTIEQAVASGMKDETELKKLMRKEPALTESEFRTEALANSKEKKATDNNIEEALAEIKDSENTTKVDEAKNMSKFDQKFELQKKEIINEMQRIVDRASDRTIKELKEAAKGPVKKILDKDIYAIWTDGGWRGNVKARHFVLALRDYYRERAENIKQGNAGIDAEPVPDEWALEYIDIAHVQPILEALDDDASGFITISEINKFTSARPEDWSLPRWIAFWTVGWYMMVRDEAQKIFKLLDDMFALLPKMMQENRPLAEDYLSRVWRGVYEITCSLNSREMPRSLEPMFREFVDAEERRLRRNLFDVRYNIDGMDALRVVVGPGRIEKNFFVLIRLILERHIEIFRFCKRRIISPKELRNAAGTVSWVLDAMNYRYNDLQTIFTNQRVDLKEQFRTFAFGIYEYQNNPEELWAKAIKDRTFDDDDSGDEAEDDDDDGDGDTSFKNDNFNIIMEYPPYEEPEDCGDLLGESYVVPAGTNAMVGVWNRLAYLNNDSEFTRYPMTEIKIVHDPSVDDNKGFKATGPNAEGGTFSLSGTCVETSEEKLYDVKFELTLSPTQSIYYFGQLDVRTGTVSGTYGGEEEPSENGSPFLLKRTPARILRFLPSPSIMTRGKARALWSYATSAVLDEVRRKSWSWSFFRERRDLRRKYIDFMIRHRENIGPKLSPEEYKEYTRCRQLLSFRDACFYRIIIQAEVTMGTHMLALDNYKESGVDYPKSDLADDFFALESYEQQAKLEPNPMLGLWHRLTYVNSESEFGRYPMTSIAMEIDPSTDDNKGFKAAGLNAEGGDFSLSGTCVKSTGGTYSVEFELVLSAVQSVYYVGTLDEALSTVTGTYGPDADPDEHAGIFLLKRTPPRLLRFRPSPSVLSKNRATALWTFAISAALDDARRRLWSWSFFRERRDLRKQYVAFMIRHREGHGTKLSPEEYREYTRCRQFLSYRDACFYQFLVRRKTRTLSLEKGYYCDSCSETIVGDRIVCIDCDSKDGLWNSMDFCFEQSCLKATVERSDLVKPHDPTHNLVMICQARQALLIRKVSKIQSTAKDIIREAQEKFAAVRASRMNDAALEQIAISATQSKAGDANGDVAVPTSPAADVTGNPESSINANIPSRPSSRLSADPMGTFEPSEASEPSEVSDGPEAPDPPEASEDGEKEVTLQVNAEKLDKEDLPKESESAKASSEASRDSEPHGLEELADFGAAIERTAATEPSEASEPDASEPSGSAESGGDEESSVTSESASDINTSCICCFEPIDLPCWLCVTCSGHVSICDNCALSTSSRKHEQYHFLLRCPEPIVPAEEEKQITEDNTASMNARLVRLEDNTEAMNERLGRMEGTATETRERLLHVEEHVRAINERQTRLENMMETLLAHVVRLATPDTTGHPVPQGLANGDVAQ